MIPKYRAHKTVIDGITFASKKEANRYLELKLLLRAGKISDLQMQVPFVLIESHRRKDGKMEMKCKYVADFTYYKIIAPGKTEYVVEDVKGFKGGAAYQLFTIKRKLMYEKYGIEVKET